MSDGLKPCPFRLVNDDGQILCELIKGSDREITLDICRACPVAQINCQHLRASLEKQVGTSVTVRFLGGRTEVWDDNPPAVAFKRAACAEKAMPIQSPRDCAGCPIRLPQVSPQGILTAARQQLRQRAGANRIWTGAAAGDPIMPAMPATAELTVRPEAAAPSPTSAMPPAPASSSPVAAQAVTHAEPAPRARTRARKVQAAEPQPTAQVPPVAQAPAAPLAPLAAAPASMENRQAQPEPTRSRAPDSEGRAETKSKIILLQQWLAAQARKKAGEIENPDIVQDIPVRRAAQAGARGAAPAPSTSYEGTEKCVGWTD